MISPPMAWRRSCYRASGRWPCKSRGARLVGNVNIDVFVLLLLLRSTTTATTIYYCCCYYCYYYYYYYYYCGDTNALPKMSPFDLQRWGFLPAPPRLVRYVHTVVMWERGRMECRLRHAGPATDREVYIVVVVVVVVVVAVVVFSRKLVAIKWLKTRDRPITREGWKNTSAMKKKTKQTKLIRVRSKASRTYCYRSGSFVLFGGRLPPHSGGTRHCPPDTGGTRRRHRR